MYSHNLTLKVFVDNHKILHFQSIHIFLKHFKNTNYPQRKKRKKKLTTTQGNELATINKSPADDELID